MLAMLRVLAMGSLLPLEMAMATPAVWAVPAQLRAAAVEQAARITDNAHEDMVINSFLLVVIEMELVETDWLTTD